MIECNPADETGKIFKLTMQTYQDALKLVDNKNIHNISKGVTGSVKLDDEDGQSPANLSVVSSDDPDCSWLDVSGSTPPNNLSSSHIHPQIPDRCLPIDNMAEDADDYIKAAGDCEELVVEIHTSCNERLIQKFVQKKKGDLIGKSPSKQNCFLAKFPEPDASSLVGNGLADFPGLGELSFSYHEPGKPTHIEVDRLEHEDNAEEMYGLLQVHLDNPISAKTKWPHSYDKEKDLYRFDLDEAGIIKLTQENQYLDSDDDKSLLTIRSATTGKCVKLINRSNSTQLELSEAMLQKHFGLESTYSSELAVEQCERGYAVIQLENCSVAALLVSMGQHTLDNDVILSATHDLSMTEDDQIPRDTSDDLIIEEAPKSRTIVCLETDPPTSERIARKFLLKSYGDHQIESMDGHRYKVTFSNPETAQRLVTQENLVIGTKTAYATFYTAPCDHGTEDVKPKLEEVPENKLVMLETEQKVSKPLVKKFLTTHHPRVQIDSKQDDLHWLLSSETAEDAKKLVDEQECTIGKSAATVGYYQVSGVEKVEEEIPDTEPADNTLVLVLDDGIKMSLLKKFLGKKYPGTTIRREPLPTERECLVECSNPDEAEGLLQNSPLKITNKLQARVHRSCDSFTEDTAPKVPTHIRVQCRAEEREPPEDEFEMIKMHFEDIIGDSELELSDVYDKESDTYILKADSEDIERLISEKQMLDKDDPTSELVITAVVAGSNIKEESDRTDREVAGHLQTDQPEKVVIISNLLDADEELLAFWVKTAFSVWPLSVQFSPGGDKAIVKMPGETDLSKQRIRAIIADCDFDLMEEKPDLVVVEPSQTIQIRVSPSDSVHQDIMTGYFCNPSKFNVSTNPQDLIVREIRDKGVFTMEFRSRTDVTTVLNTPNRTYANYTFDVAEYYPSIGVCDDNSLTICSYRNKEKGASADLPVPKLVVKYVDEADLDDLKGMMRYKKASQGDKYKSFAVTDTGDVGRVDVDIIYVDQTVAERVYRRHLQKPLELNRHMLQLELVSTQLLDCHHEESVRLYGITPDVHPAKLKFYLSALSDNVITQILFDAETETKAVATFSKPIDFGKLMQLHDAIGLKECEQLKIRQEDLPCQLVAVTEMKKYDLEMPLENHFEGLMKREVTVTAEPIQELPGKFMIRVERAALKETNLAELKSILAKCSQLHYFSEHLGLHTTKGMHKRSKLLSEVIDDNRMLKFLLDLQLPGFQALQECLLEFGIQMTTDGTMSAESNRQSLKHWRTLRQIVKTFLESDCSHYVSNPPLTEQVFTQIDKILPQLMEKSKVIYGIGSEANCLHLVGLVTDVNKMKEVLQKSIGTIERKIQEERETTTVPIPNVKQHQLQFLMVTGFFERVKKAHNLKDIQPSLEQETVTISGRPASINDVQKEMLDLLPKVEKSKVSSTKSAQFIDVFKRAQGKIEQALQRKQKSECVTIVENKTISIYSNSIDASKEIMHFVSDQMMMEVNYPLGVKFDEAEKMVIQSEVWRETKEQWCKKFDPLKILESPDLTSLNIVGTSVHRKKLFETIKTFFEENTLRVQEFQGESARNEYMLKFMRDEVQATCSRNRLELCVDEKAGTITIKGAKNEIEVCLKELKGQHDKIVKRDHTVTGAGRIQLVKEDLGFLHPIQMATNCLVVERPSDCPTGAHHQLPLSIGTELVRDGLRFEFRLQNGSKCEVRKGDITQLDCDALVNPANGSLQNNGGLAAVISKAGGQSIQDECNRYMRQKRRMMDGEVTTTNAGSLKCKKIIHVVGPVYKGGRYQEEAALRKCIDRSFDECARLELNSIAIPPVSTGIFKYPVEDAAVTILEAINQRIEKGKFLPRLIILIDNQDESLQVYERELRKQFDVVATDSSFNASNDASQPSPTAKRASSNYIISGDDTLVFDNLSVVIEKGDLSDSKEEALVVSVGQDLNLSKGRVSKVISNKAGPELQNECNTAGSLNLGDVLETEAYLMPCNKIIHCCTPSWKSYAETVPILKEMVKKCLAAATAREHDSIAFPSLGTGNLNYPPAETATHMLEAIAEYHEENADVASLTTVKIILFPADGGIIQAFTEILKTYRNGSMDQPVIDQPVDDPPAVLDGQSIKKPKRRWNLKGKGGKAKTGPKKQNIDVQAGLRPTQELKGCIQLNRTLLRILKGDITEHRANVLVNSTDHKLTMAGEVGRTLLRKAGGDVEKELKELRKKGSQNGIWTSGAGLLESNYIIHLNSNNLRADMFTDAIHTVLRKCSDLKVKSVAFPAIGTGRKGYPARDMAKIILESVVKYLNDNKDTAISIIDVVIFQEEMVNDFVESMKHVTNKKDKPWWQKLGVVSDFISFFAGGHDENVNYGELAIRNLDEDNKAGDTSKLELEVYSKYQRDIDTCIDILEKRLDDATMTVIWSQKPSYEDDKENIIRLSSDKDMVRNLYVRSQDLKCGFELDSDIGNVKITGNVPAVVELQDMVRGELQKIERLIHSEREAELFALARQWLYQEEDGSWVEFEPAANRDIEERFSRNQKATFSLEVCDEDSGTESILTVSLEPMTLSTADGVTMNIKRKDMMQEVGHPKHWTSPTDKYLEVVVDPISEEFKQVADSLMATVAQRGSSVIEVKRIQNPTAYQSYMVWRRGVARKLGKPEEAVEKFPLWHGTEEKTVEKITKGKFDRGLSGKNAVALGKGSYFALNSSYSAQDTYCRKNAQDEKFMIYTRVITGEYTLGNKSLLTAPNKPGSDTEQFDSVVNNVDNPTIFVVFHDQAALPEYVIKFK